MRVSVGIPSISLSKTPNTRSDKSHSYSLSTLPITTGTGSKNPTEDTSLSELDHLSISHPTCTVLVSPTELSKRILNGIEGGGQIRMEDGTDSYPWEPLRGQKTPS